ncbi:MAG: hypothetical protein LBJ20_02445 [Candidatus Methanoplasma sp.]|jgi:hypothetical protein|nr:hypothetical protein [Candidatus Methanoplasma sp.]
MKTDRVIGKTWIGTGSEGPQIAPSRPLPPAAADRPEVSFTASADRSIAAACRFTRTHRLTAGTRICLYEHITEVSPSDRESDPKNVSVFGGPVKTADDTSVRAGIKGTCFSG